MHACGCVWCGLGGVWSMCNRPPNIDAGMPGPGSLDTEKAFTTRPGAYLVHGRLDVCRTIAH